MIRLIGLTFLFFCSLNTFGQKAFKINNKGEVHGKKINEIIKNRKYQAVSGFDTVSFDPVLVYALYIKDNKMGILDVFGKEITEAVYDDIRGMNRDYPTTIMGFQQNFTVKNEGKYGLINPQGELLLPIKYDYISYEANKKRPPTEKRRYLLDSLYEARIGKEKFIINTEGEIVNNLLKSKTKEREEVHYKSTKISDLEKNEFGIIHIKLANGHVIVKNISGNRFVYGVVDEKTKQIIIPIEQTFVQADRNNNYIVKNKDKKTGILDTTGKIIVNYEYDDISLSTTGMRFLRNGKFAYFTNSYTPITEFKFERERGGLRGGIIIVVVEGKHGLVTEEGEELTEFVYEELRTEPIGQGSDGYVLLASKNGKKGILDSLGNIILDFKHDVLVSQCVVEEESDITYRPFMDGSPDCTWNGYYYFKADDKFGIYDVDFNIIVEGYDGIIKSSDNMVYLGKKEGNKLLWGLYNLKKKVFVTEIMYDDLRRYRGGYFSYEKYFYGNLYRVKSNKLYGIIDETGKQIMPISETQSFEISLIYNGLISLKYGYGGKEQGFLDYKGNKLKFRIE